MPVTVLLQPPPPTLDGGTRVTTSASESPSTSGLRILRAWLGEHLPTTAEMPHEGFQAIARCASVIAGWRPLESQWRTVYSIALNEGAKLDSMSGAHSSSLAPNHANAMFGDFSNWPLYSSLVAGSNNPKDPTWSFVAALVAWPCLGANVAGMHVDQIPKSHSLALQIWLRESLRNPDSLATMRRLLGEASMPQHLLLADTAPKGTEGKLLGALKAHAKAYLRSYPDALLAPTSASGEDAVEFLPSAIRKVIDDSVASRPENEGLAPDDAGAVRYISHDEAAEDETTDVLERHRLRCLASAREFNHLPLHWGALHHEERRILHQALETGMHTSTTREGTVAIAICALLALSPADVSALAIHHTLDAAIANLTTASTTLVWVDDQLVALQGVPRPECAYQRKDEVPMLRHVAYKALGIPPEVSAAIIEAGGRSQDKLLRCFPTLVVAARELAAGWRKTTGARLHLGRIRRAVADCILELTRDECIAAAILPGANIPTGAGSYYSAIPAERAFELHRQAAGDVLPWAILDMPAAVMELFRGRHVGSELLIPRDALAEALADLHGRAQAASETGRRTIELIAHAFNQQTMYAVALASLLTTHRPTHAPFPRPQDIDPSMQRALLVDKRAHSRSTQRVVPIPAQLASQVEAYRKSVEAVSSFLDGGFPELAGTLRSTLVEDDGTFPSAAAFSLLTCSDGVWQVRPFAPSDWKTLWPEWLWPLNGNRHVLMQWLQEQGVRRESLNYLFGHAEPGQTLFGRDCAVSIDEFCAEMRPLLERFGDVLNIRNLAPIRAYGRSDVRAAPIRLPAPGFGDDARPQPRTARLSGPDMEICRRILRDDTVAAASSTEERTDLIEALVAREFRSDVQLRTRALALLRRWQRLHPAGKPPAKERRIPFAPEATPVTRTELRDVERGRQIQVALLGFICAFVGKRAEAEDMDIASWLALLSLSAIAFGGKHAPDTRRQWLDAVPNGIFHTKGSLWVEWTQSGRLNRWCADPVSALLIAHFVERTAGMPHPPEKDVRAGVNRILAELPPLKGVGAATRRQKLFSGAMRALHRSSIPGPLMAHMVGDRPSACVPRETLLRETGARLLPDQSLQEDLAIQAGRPRQTPTPRHHTDPAGIALNQLTRAIARAQGSSQRGGEASGTRGNRLKNLETELRQLESATDSPDTTFQIVCSRLRELAHEGGRLKSILATSTIAAYMRPVIAFARTEVGRQLLTADPLQIEETYRRLVLRGCASKAHERLASLQDFHEHAVLHFGATPVDWHDVAAELPQGANHVDANLVYRHEVELASALIGSTVDLPAHMVLMAQAVLHLMFDLGLRFGEVFRLRAKDVLADEDYLYIRNTGHGEVKSHAGTRTIPLKQLLGAPGKAILSSLLVRARRLSNGDPATPLFCDPGDPRALVLRADIVRIVAHALRAATGDLSIRPHHLRHSAATNTYGLLVVDGLDGKWARGDALRQAVLSEVAASRRATHAQSQLLGHGGHDTTAHFYVHQQEFRVANWMDKLLPDMSSVEIAGLTGWNDARVRKAWASGKSTVDILRTALSGLLTGQQSMDAWRGIRCTSEPLPKTLRTTIARPTIELPRLREFLLHRFQTGLPPEALASLHGVPPVFAHALCRSVVMAVHRTAFALSFMPADDFQLWPGYAIRTTSTLQVPPHLETLPSIQRMHAIPASREWAEIAATFVRTFDPDQNCWEVSTRIELEAVTHWMQLIQIDPRDVTIEMPCIEDRVPNHLQLIAGHFCNANFVPADPRQNRVRGGDRIRIRVRPDGFSIAATTLAQATFLWVVRALASLEE